MTINLIIFSKDRPAQLDLLLRSMVRLRLRDVFSTKVLYLASNEKFREAYFQCFSEWSFPEPCVQQLPFGPATQAILANHSGFTTFSTDDMVFYREPEVDLLEVVNRRSFTPNNVFSLRLGYNTVVQDCHEGTRQPYLHTHVNNEGVLRWAPANYVRNTNYGYPLALDLHIFNSNFIRDLLSKFRWNNTNEMEGGLQKFTHTVSELWSLPHSIAVNIPCNNLSGLTRSGETYPYSTEALNEAYLAGKRIDLDSILQEKIVGCHQEIKLTLKEQ